MICSVFLTILLVLGVITFFLWLSLRPHRPRFHVKQFSIPSLSQASGFENAEISFNLTVRNPNQHISVYYDTMEGTVYTTIIADKLSGATISVNSQRWTQFMNDRAQGTVQFRLDVTSTMRLKLLTWLSKHHRMHATCEVSVGSDGLILATSKDKRFWDGSIRFPFVIAPKGCCSFPGESHLLAEMELPYRSRNSTEIQWLMAKLVLPLLCVLLVTCGALSVSNKSRYNCSSDPSSYAPNSTYQANLQILLASLSSSAARGHLYQYSSAGSGEGAVVYGSFLCRGDTSQENCRNCVEIASARITQSCPNSRVSIIYYEKCMLRYDYWKFDSVMEKDPLLYNYNDDVITEPDKFNKLLRTTITQLVAGPKRRGISYLHREVVFVSQMTLYLFAQCTPDLTVTDCGNCLGFAAEKLENLEWARIGGRVLLPSCFMQYEIYPFYETDWADDRYLGKNVTIALSFSTVGFLLTIIGCCVFLTIKIEQGRRRDEEIPVKRQILELDSLQFHLATIEAATGDFSNENKLGEGGFGSVYKGTLPDGQEIAAKRMSRFSGQGVEEFKNEVESAAKLQHRNLVRLLGYSVERDETVVVYEYVHNGSLDHLLFEPELRRRLDWTTRLKIVLGVARGLLYLHEDSRLRVIHRDIKASNILLDADMNPKISDFGMARIIGASQTQANTNRIVGTFGYLSPEYMSFGEFSVKSDVFSFGILVLEIITGKKNNRFLSLECEDSLLGYVWNHWRNRTLIEVVDPALGSGYHTCEAFRCLHVGLLCVQDDAEDRPTMDYVLRMLKNDSMSLPQPLQPMFFFPSGKFKRGSRADPSNDNSTPPSSVPGSSITDLVPR